MTRKRDVDQRQEPSEGSAGTFRVDRVFIPKKINPADLAVPNSDPRPTRTRTASVAPESGDMELSLRRGLSRLQRQLAEAQRELANKDDELAAEVEKRQTAFSSYDSILDDHRHVMAEVEELRAHKAQTADLEQRLAVAVSNMEEVAGSLDRERKQRAVEQARVDELTLALDDAHMQWSSERSAAELKSSTELEELEGTKRTAVAAAEAAADATLTRQREAYERELVELRASHERSLSTLRGELEPRALEARGLAEERERLASELAALKAEAVRVAADREEAKAKELAQLAELAAREQTTQQRLFATELARAHQERDAQTLALQQASRSAEARERGHEHELGSLRDVQKKLERELAEARDRCARLEAENASGEELVAAAAATTERLFDDKRMLEERLQASQTDARRNALDRLRFVAYLEEGLALLGALPPTAIEPGHEPDDPGKPT